MTKYSIEQLQQQIKYLKLLATRYPTVQSACTEIINLQAILQLPKGTEHFMSDIHGEYEAFYHIFNNCSGVIKEKIDMLLSNSVSDADRAQLATLIYYPRLKLKEVRRTEANYDGWCRLTLYRLIDVCRTVSVKYTRSKVRKALPEDYSYIIDELLHADYSEHNKDQYYREIVDTILSLDRADAFIIALSTVIKQLAVDHLHILGDLFDRGQRPDLVMDLLTEHHSTDIQWGNHDVLWMGAASGSEACIANVVVNSLHYGNLEVLESAYGINLRPLSIFARDTYPTVSKVFLPQTDEHAHTERDTNLIAQMQQAIEIIRFKLEGQIIQRHPEYDMNDRLLLDKIDRTAGTVNISGTVYPLRDCFFPTVSANDPYKLTDEERALIDDLKSSFLHSEKLQKHIKFLLEKGNIYKCYNGNLLYHGCIPLREDGSFDEFPILGEACSGKQLMDRAEALVRQGYFLSEKNEIKQYCLDFVWYLWCGKKSPLFGRERMTSFERLYVADQDAWREPRNPYYRYNEEEVICQDILREFGLDPNRAHIINGHVPVKLIQGESPIKANGRLVMIDGGLCKAYQPKTGIAGYTLIYNSHGMRLVAHQPFGDLKSTIQNNLDIHSSTNVFEKLNDRMMVKNTDKGVAIKSRIEDLTMLVSAYRMGML